jgi:hypothetical protein
VSQRLDTKGHLPTVEYRSSVDRYIIVYESLGVELAPVFRNKYAAQEVAINAFYGEPFFTMIPTVPIGTEYPRPGILPCKVRDLEIQLRIA